LFQPDQRLEINGASDITMTTHSSIVNQWQRRLAFAAAGIVLTASLHAEQTVTPAEAAAKLSGTWKINRELSPGFRAPGGRRGGPGGGSAARFNAAPRVAMQRRIGGDAPASSADRTPEELAAMAAMRELQQLADEITINATAERVTFTDVRGERSYTADGKNTKIPVAGTEVSTKTKWDKTALKQEFSTASSKLTQTWDVGADGRLVLIAKVESLRLRTPEQKAVFDRKQN
jgi:hypothetical protein